MNNQKTFIVNYIRSVPAALTVFGHISLLVFVGDLGAWVAEHWFLITRTFWQYMIELPFSIRINDSEKDGLTALFLFLPMLLTLIMDSNSKNNITFLKTLLGLIAAIIILAAVYNNIFTNAKSIILGTVIGFYSIFKWLICFQIKYALFPMIIISLIMILSLGFIKVFRIEKLLKTNKEIKTTDKPKNNRFYAKILVVFILSITLVAFYVIYKHTIFDMVSLYNESVNYSVDYFFAPFIALLTLINITRGFFQNSEYTDDNMSSNLWVTPTAFS